MFSNIYRYGRFGQNLVNGGYEIFYVFLFARAHGPHKIASCGVAEIDAKYLGERADVDGAVFTG